MPMYKGFEACEGLLKHLTYPSQTPHIQTHIQTQASKRISVGTCYLYVRSM